MDDLFADLLGDDEVPRMVDTIVNVYLVSGDTIPLKDTDAHDLFDRLNNQGFVSIRDYKGTNIHLFRHGVAGVAGFSKAMVEEQEKRDEERRERLKRILGDEGE